MDSQAGGNGYLVDEMLSHLKPPIPVVDRDDDSKVAAFYAGRSVFITGATGFIGKTMIEKLIRSCPAIKRIFILVREKRGKSVHERLTDLVKLPWFDRIRQMHGESSSRLLESKLCAIKGDITRPKFGISPDDMRLLSDECSVVINSAATIRFHEPIDMAVTNNIYSVGQLVEFCNELANLKALIHISTAYSNCHKRDTIHEKFYKPPMGGDEIQETIATMRKTQTRIDSCVVTGKLQSFYEDSLKYQAILEQSDRAGANNNSPPAHDLLAEFTRIVLRRSNCPNTYTFTKLISENYLLEKVRAHPERYLNDKIQVAILRPAIVCAAWREPLVGLVDNFNAATGLYLALYTGTLQAMSGYSELVSDWVPVDMFANMVLSVGWFLVERPSLNGPGKLTGIKRDQGVYLFNFVSGPRNPLYAHQYLECARTIGYKYPSKHLARLPSSYFIRPGKLYDWYDTINHKLPAYLLYLIKSKLLGLHLDRSTCPIASYKRNLSIINQLTPFTSNQWEFTDHNTLALYEGLDAADKRVFPFDVAMIDMRQYLWASIIGGRIYTLHDKPETLPVAMKQLQRRRTFYALSMGALFIALVAFLILL